MANQEPQCPRCREFGHTYGICPEHQWAMKRTAELSPKGSKKVVDEQVRQEERDQRRERLRERHQKHPGRDPRRRTGNHNGQQQTQDSSTSETPTTEPEQSMDPTAQQSLTYRPAPSTSPLDGQLETISSSVAEQTRTETPALSPTPAPTTPSPGPSLPNWSTPSTPQPYNPPPQPTTWRAKWHFSNGIPPPRHYDAIVGGYPAWYEPYFPPAPGEDYNLTPISRTPTRWGRMDRDGDRERERRSASPSPEERGSGRSRRGYRRRG
ncbi:hypothetical protein BDV19DRAFT_393190 [Aspergillus venezuelensis]